MRRKRESAEARFARLLAFDHDLDPTAWKRSRLAGVDEAGVGPLAGPVVAAAVILPHDFRCIGLDDSKKMSAEERRRCERLIRREALAITVSRVAPRQIDRFNILNAMLLAQKRALERLPLRPLTVIVDGKRPPRLPRGWRVRMRTIVRGDSASLCVAAASVIAKSARDRIMQRLDRIYPGYGFAEHKGYATSLHKEAVRKLGMTPEHRRSFCHWIENERILSRQNSLF